MSSHVSATHISYLQPKLSVTLWHKQEEWLSYDRFLWQIFKEIVYLFIYVFVYLFCHWQGLGKETGENGCKRCSARI